MYISLTWIMINLNDEINWRAYNVHKKSMQKPALNGPKNCPNQVINDPASYFNADIYYSSINLPLLYYFKTKYLP